MKRASLATFLLLTASMTLGCHSPRLGSLGASYPAESYAAEELACSDGSCYVGQCPDASAGAPGQQVIADASAGVGAAANYQVNGGQGGPLADYHNRHYRGPQSHLGAMPGPAMGPPQPTVTYPYYTVRGPRDYFLDNPPTIGR